MRIHDARRTFSPSTTSVEDFAATPFSAEAPILTGDDYHRIKHIIRRMRHTLRYGFYVNALERKLRRARVVPAAEIPSDVVTMNTRVRLDSPADNHSENMLLVYPHFGMERDGYACVLGRLGTALLGSRTGDEIQILDGRPLRIGGILYQPEAVGDFYL